MAFQIGAGIKVGGGITIQLPAGGGGGGATTPDITGSLTIGSGAIGYGFAPGVPMMFIPATGSLTSTPSSIIDTMAYNTNNSETEVKFKTGTFTGANGSLTVTDAATINSKTTYSVKIGSVTQTLTSSGSNWISIAGDPFNLQSQSGSTVSFEITLVS